MSFLRQSPQAAAICLSMLAPTFALTAAAEESNSNALLECAALQDPDRRLECFDNAVSVPQPPAAVPETVASPAAPPNEPAAAVAPAVAPVAAAVPAVAPVAAAAPAVAPAATTSAESELSPVDEFGMNATVAAQSANQDRPARLTEISSLVTHVRKRAYGELVVTLENGQVWTEKESEYGFRVKEGDTVTIRQGNFGGFRMIGRGRRSSQVVRVQ